tara:strand:- start:31542 stop:33104 length:1563 start_codon:yes stop_codon:yes gene_type:complete
MEYKLRDYQQRWCRKTYDAFVKGVGGQRPTRIMSTAATGAGKTVMASAFIWTMIRKHDKRALFLADTDDLIDQAASGIFNATGLIPSIEQSTNQGNRRSMNVVGSIQSISQPDRLASWDPDHFGLVIADEAHLSMADSWQRTLKHFNQDGKGAWILGVTATPERGDDKDLWDFYEHLGDEVGLFELIDGGHLAPLTVETVPIHIDATKAAIQANYADEGNEMASAIEPYWEQMIKEWQTRAGDRKTLAFHPGCSASKRFTDMLIKHGVKAAHIDGNSKDRKAILQAFSDGDIEFLNCANLLQKGYDCPSIRCVLIMKPTQSRVAYQQMAGRGTRKCDGKTDCLLLDFFWQFAEKMKPCGPADLVTRDPKERAAVAKILRDNPQQDLAGAISEAQLATEQSIVDRLQALSTRGGGLRFDARDLGSLLHQPELATYQPTAKWEHEGASPAQTDMLTKAGVLTEGMTKGAASQMIETLISRRDKNMATPKQIAMLATRGIEDGHTLTFTEAGQAIDRSMQHAS